MKISIRRSILNFAFIQALVATLGSLYFSEIAHFTPCTLCWYQRICMYPLIVILGAGILENNKKIYRYALPLSITGWVISVYHNLIQYGVIPESTNICNAAGSCTQRYVDGFGFITIPLLSLIAFTVINVILFRIWKQRVKSSSQY